MLVVLIIGVLMNLVALPLAGLRVVFLYRTITSGQPAPDRIRGVTKRTGAVLKRQVVEVFGQKKLLKWSLPGFAHFFVFWAFVILATVYVELYGSLIKLLIHGGDAKPDWAIPLVGHWAVLGFLQDFIAVMAVVGLAIFTGIRIKNAPKELGRKSRFFGSHLGPAWFTLAMIFNVIWTLFVYRGASSALGNLPYKSGAFVSIGVGNLLGGLSHSALEAIEGVGLLLHLGVMLSFLLFVLNSKHLHIFIAPINVAFGRDPVALGAAKPLMSAGKPITLDDLDDLDEDAKLGVGATEDFSWKGILDFATCTECGRCQSQCPAWNTEKPLSPKLMIMALRDAQMAKAPYLLADEGKREALLEGDTALKTEVERPLVADTGDEWFYMPEDGSAVIDPDVLWSCVTCGACVQQCPVDIEHVDHIVDMRRYQVLVESNFPAELNGLFKGMENKGNPWNMSATARLDWAKDLDFEVKVLGEDVESMDDVEWLFWVGCAGAYEDRAKKTTRAVAELLDTAGVSFAVLGNGETCTGDSARRAGNEFVFQGLAQQNIETFTEYKVKKVVSTCAHCFNTLKNEYKQLGYEMEVVHHTQLLNRLVREKKLVPVAAQGGSRSVTYHDPCYIGRHNQVYEAPRELLNVIPDADFVEMPRNSERSFCCGAGGARMWMEETIGTRINETRTAEAVATGADQIAVGCPFCRVMLSDGLTSAQSKGEAREEVEVLDVAQMLLASIKGESPAKAPASSAPSAKADVATQAEPSAGDVTQTEETVTKTEDAGPAAKASSSGGGSLFDVGSDEAGEADEPQPAPANADTKDPEKAEAGPASGGSLFDVSGDDEEPEPAAKADEKPDAKAEEPAKADLGSGGSLFDIGDDSADEPETPAKPGAGEDAAGDSTTDEDVDRAADAADTDIEPEEKSEPEPEAKTSEPAKADLGSSGSLFDIEEDDEPEAPAKPEAGEDAAGDSTTDEDVDRAADDADTDIEPEEKSEPEPEAKTSEPAKADLGSSGSLFDIEEDDEPEAPAKPEAGEDAAGDSTTDEDVDRAADDADTDVEPEPEPEPESKSESKSESDDEPEPAAKAEAESSSDEDTSVGAYSSLFDIAAPSAQPTAKADPAPEPDPEPEAKAEPEAAADEEPEKQADDAPIRSLKDIKAAGGSAQAADEQEAPEQEPESAAEESEAGQEAEEAAAEDEPNESDDAPAKPAPASSGETHAPKTDVDIADGGSLFDL